MRSNKTRSLKLLAVAGLVGMCGRAALAAPPLLPVPCTPGACGATGASKFVTGGAATAVATPSSLTINQSSNSAILNWAAFDIAAGNSVTFAQPNASAIALNRIFEGNPSQIFGKLSANGQIYLVNLNGFVFGANSTVNVAGLIASSLPLALTDATFANGILSPLQNGGNPSFDASLDPLAPGGRTSVLDVNGKPVLDDQGKPISVQVVVQPGAQITAADQGRILLAGQNVTNGGTLTAPDGQVILAAGTKLFLQADTDPGLRGLVVEVDGTTTTAADGSQSTNTAMNQVSGVLSAPRGNVWMVGLAVNQDGRISATTSVSANGSIHLEAAGNVNTIISSGGNTVSSTRGGALTIGPQSQLSIATDSSGGTAVSAQTQLPSTITLLGEQVDIQGGSITAPGATLTAIAAANPAQAAATPVNAATSTAIDGVGSTPDANARLHIDAGTSIDLSGSTASLPVTANLVSGQLRSSELADDPTQRNGLLHGDTVYINALEGSPPIANLSGEIGAVPQTIQQRTEAGGHATFQSEGDIVFASGAVLNVSGGSSTYAGGVLQNSYLIGANGQLYNIATANPLLTYIGVVNPTFTQNYNTWGVQDVVSTPGLSYYQPGYVQGASGGGVQFAAANMVLQGKLLGNTVDGLYQRTPTTAATGSQLTIGVPGGITPSTTAAADLLAPAIELTNSPIPIEVADDTTLIGPQTLQIPASYLTSSGFGSINLYSNYGVTLPVDLPLQLPGGSNLVMAASHIDILSSITDPGGKLQLQNIAALGTLDSSAPRPGVYIGDGVTLDVRGQWTNDLALVNGGHPNLAQTWQNGGSIVLGVSSIDALLSLGSNVTLHASGGAWVQSSGSTVAGTGGSISLNADGLGGGLDVGSNLAIDAFGVNGAKGGGFSLVAPRLEISNGTAGSWTMAQSVDDDGPAPGGVFQLYAGLFSDYGFQSVTLTADALVAQGAATTNVLTVDPATQIAASVSTLIVDQSALPLPSAANVTRIANVGALPAYQLYDQGAAGIQLNALPNPAGGISTLGTTNVGDVYIGQGASLSTAPGGTLGISALDSIIVDGTLRAPGGTISLQVFSPGASSSPYGNYEAGFLPTQRIELGADSVIDVSGAFVPKPSAQGLSLGTLLPGGTVNVFADRGAVLADGGSTIDVSGASAKLDVLQPNGSYGPEIAVSAGGAITVRSGEAVSLLGNIEASAGSGGTSGTAAAGSLEVDLTRGQPWWGIATIAAVPTFNQAPLTIDLAPTIAANLPGSAADSNQSVLGAAQLSQSGIDALKLESGNVVQFSGTFSLGLGRRLIVDAPIIEAGSGANVQLNAPYLQLGYTSQPEQPNTALAQPGTGTLEFAGNEIDLAGVTVFQGASNVSFSSSGDLKLVGAIDGTNATATSLSGGLSIEGDLQLAAARIYPTTGTSFNITALENPANGIPGLVTIAQNGINPGTPLSADGAVSITAYDVTNNGTLYAPFGSIALTGADAVNLGYGSLTSVSGNGLTIPFGSTQYSQSQWTYLFGYTPSTITGIPTRAVNLTAANITIAKNATIDLAGGGDLSAYEWVPGPGGSTDALAPGVTPGLYAVLPYTRGEAAPQDAQESDPSIVPGESVYLSGGAGIAAGAYPLLPARDALLPGAFLVRIEPSFQSTAAGKLGSLADGTPVIAGYLTYGSTGLHQTPGYEGFAVYPGSYGGQLAAYDISLASSFFSAAAVLADASRPALPADAGSLSLAVSRSLQGAGTVQTAAANGGLEAPIQIAAPDLYIGTAPAGLPSDTVTLSDTLLDSWRPGMLLLGGQLADNSVITTTSSATTVTPQPASTSTIDVLANTVTLGAGSNLKAGQVVVVANNTIDVRGGATVQSTSAVAGAAPMPLPAQQAVTLSNPDAALLAVSDSNWLVPLHAALAASDGTTAAAASSAGSGGVILLESGASLASRGSVTLDGLGGVTLAGALAAPGAEISLGSSSIALGAGSSSDALIIDDALLGELGGAGAVRLASTGAIDILSPISLGLNGSSPTLSALTLQGSSLNNSSAAGSAQFGAQLMILQGSGTAQASVAQNGAAASSLSLVAGEMAVGPNVLTVNGFAATHATVSGAIVGQCVAASCSGGLAVGGDMTLTASGITVTSGANTSFSAVGALNIGAASSTAALPAYLGGSLTLSGGSIDVAGRLSAPSGAIDLVAANDLSVESAASISAAGSLVSIGNQTVATPAGTISAAAGGAMTLMPGATLDVSGAGSGAAGAISLAAAGPASIGATLNGAAGSGAAGGRFALDAGSLVSPAGSGGNPLTLLATSLGSGSSSAGGFDTAIDIRVRSGDLDLDGASTLNANAVSLTADTGNVRIGGQILAPSASLRGSLSIFGGAGVDIAAGAALRADGSGPQGQGGTIEIGAGTLVADANGLLDAYNDATLSIDAGSTLSTAGNAAKGTLLLRAPALIAANDVAITSLAGDTSAVGQIVIEPILPFNTAGAAFSSASAPTLSDFQNVGQTVMAYWNGASGNIASRLAGSGTASVTVEPAVEIIAPGSLTLPALDFVANQTFYSTAQQASIPVDFTVRAAGNIELAGTLSDGFNVQQVGDDGRGVLQPTLLTTPSSSFRLVAGADLAAANPLAVVAANAANGNLALDQGAYVRTGTGAIDLVAAGNITLAGPGSGAYTAGVVALAPGGTAGPNGTPYPGVSSDAGTTAPNEDENGNNVFYGMFVPGTSVLASYPTAGGNLTVVAGGNIDNTSNTLPGSVTAWQVRESPNSNQSASWGVNLAAYDWNFGTLGGGDLRITSGGSALNVSAAAAGSLLPQAAAATPAYSTSGGLSFAAAKDIGSAQVYLANGTGSVSAGGGLTATLPASNPNSPNVGSAFYLQSSVVDVETGLGAVIDGIFDPATLIQPIPSGLRSLPVALLGSFFSYSGQSALDVQSLSGDIVLGTSSVAAATLLGLATDHANPTAPSLYPAGLTLQALNGNIRFGPGVGSPFLYPTPTGQLDLLAARDIAYTSASGSIIVSDAPPASVPTVTNIVSGDASTALTPSFGGDVHSDDPTPAYVTAGGSIENLSLVIPKAAQIVAALDISNLTYTGQNLNPQDLTLISAGRDFINATGGAVSVGGPGSLDILAGRNIDLGFSQGVVTTGNLLNANLPTAQGADITMVTGLGTTPTYANFVSKIIDTSSTYENALVDYVESVQGTNGLSMAAAESAFNAFGINQQRPFIDQVFFDELSASGLADNTVPNAGFTRGYAAIDALYPGSRAGQPGYVAGSYAGDLTLQFSRIYTLSGGDINLIVPGGGIDVGLANPPSTLSSRPASTLGIVTEQAGNVNIYSQGDVNVNSSRIFTLGGGNILIWSNQGSIDAGLGAKTSVSAPPPAILISSDGTVTIDFSGAATGSGIRTIQTEPSTPPGNVDLIAPVGTVNAGDAGIGAAGNINIAAQSVIGVTNINFGGTATGVPAVVSNVSASLSGASNASSGASNAATNAVSGDAAAKESQAPLSQSALSWLDVFVTGLGEENCKPDDIECLKRQKTTTR